jgi:hypothetical protein
MPAACPRVPFAFAALVAVASGWPVAAWSASPAAAVVAGEAVNPFNGQPRSLESTQRRLEQMRLETQLLEEEARQATLRGTIAAARAGPGDRRGLPPALPGVPAGTVPPASPIGGAGAGGSAATRAPGPRRPQPPAPPVVARPGAASASAALGMAPAATGSPTASAAAPGGAQLLAILRDGERRRAVLQMGLSALTVQEGDDVQGMRVGAIGDNALTLDGRMIELLRGLPSVPPAERRAATSAAPPPPVLARPQPPLPLAAPAGNAALGGRPASPAPVPWPALPPLSVIEEAPARAPDSAAPGFGRPRAPGMSIP